jgi:amidase
VAAGFAPISIDTETDGSLNMPATRTALYTIKPTIGIISGADIIPISPFADSAGLMAKCAHDIGALLDVLVDKEKTQKPLRGYESCMAESFAGLRIGSLDPERWKWPARVTTPNEGAEKQIVGFYDCLKVL